MKNEMNTKATLTIPYTPVARISVSLLSRPVDLKISGA